MDGWIGRKGDKMRKITRFEAGMIITGCTDRGGYGMQTTLARITGFTRKKTKGWFLPRAKSPTISLLIAILLVLKEEGLLDCIMEKVRRLQIINGEER